MQATFTPPAAETAIAATATAIVLTKLKDYLSAPDELSVNNLTVSGTVSVELPAGVASGAFITTTAMPNVSGATFNVYVGGALDSSLRVIVTDEGLQIAPKAKGAKFFFH